MEYCARDYFSEPGEMYCTYDTQKNRWVAFGLQLLFGPFGAADMYTERVFVALLKIVLVVLCFTIPMICMIRYDSFNESSESMVIMGMFLTQLCVVTVQLWWAIDTIAYGFSIYTDGYGVPLNPW